MSNCNVSASEAKIINGLGTKAAALEYVGKGWPIVYMDAGVKGPTGKGWQHQRLTVSDVNELMDDGQNVGIMLGTPSGLVDVDCDSAAGVTCAAYFLPETEMRHGRPGKLFSHYWYAVEAPEKTTKYQHVSTGSIIEVRSTGGQTVAPPSLHPSGERYGWHRFGQPATATWATLTKAAGQTAAAALLSAHWKDGTRNSLKLGVAGGLLRAGWDAEAVENFITAVADAAGSNVPTIAGIVRSTEAKLEAGEQVSGWPSVAQIVGDEIVTKVRGWLGIDVAAWIGQDFGGTTPKPPAGPSAAPTPPPEDHAEEKDDDAKPPRPDATDVALGLMAGMEFWRSNGKAYASVKVAGHREHYPIRSKAFAAVVAHRYFRKSGKAMKANKIEEVINNLEGRAFFDGAEHEVAYRTARVGDAIFLDTGRPDWSAIEVTPSGWRIVTECPVRFLRGKTHGQLYSPSKGGTLADFKQIFNVDDAQLPLLLAFMVGALKGRGSYWSLAVSGEQGTAKSTFAKRTCEIIDPQTSAALSSLPRDAEELLVTSARRLLPCFDNVSHISAEQSDALCTLATGAGFRTRQRYTDDEEAVIEACRPVVLNGIADFVNRSDLMDRSILLTLTPLEGRVTDAELDRRAAALGPKILGYLLDLMAAGLAAPETTTCHDRMADCYLWAVRCGIAGFADAHRTMKHTARTNNMANDATYQRLSRWLAGRNFPVEVAVGELFDAAFRDAGKGSGLPTSPRGLGDRLRRLAPDMRTIDRVDVRVGISRDKAKRSTATFRRVSADVGGDSADVADVGSDDIRHGNATKSSVADVADVADVVSLNQKKGVGDETIPGPGSPPPQEIPQVGETTSATSATSATLEKAVVSRRMSSEATSANPAPKSADIRPTVWPWSEAGEEMVRLTWTDFWGFAAAVHDQEQARPLEEGETPATGAEVLSSPGEVRQFTGWDHNTETAVFGLTNRMRGYFQIAG